MYTYLILSRAIFLYQLRQIYLENELTHVDHYLQITYGFLYDVVNVNDV
jgi:hypothetical protein